MPLPQIVDPTAARDVVTIASSAQSNAEIGTAATRPRLLLVTAVKDTTITINGTAVVAPADTHPFAVLVPARTRAYYTTKGNGNGGNIVEYICEKLFELPPPGIPDAPGIILSSPIGQGRINVTATAPATAAWIEIQRSRNANFSSPSSAIVYLTNTPEGEATVEHSFTNLSAGQNRVRARSINEDATGPWSETFSTAVTT